MLPCRLTPHPPPPPPPRTRNPTPLVLEVEASIFGRFESQFEVENILANSIDPDEVARYEPSHLNLLCLYMLFLVCQAERVNIK